MTKKKPKKKREQKIGGYYKGVIIDDLLPKKTRESKVKGIVLDEFEDFLKRYFPETIKDVPLASVVLQFAEHLDKEFRIEPRTLKLETPEPVKDTGVQATNSEPTNEEGPSKRVYRIVYDEPEHHGQQLASGMNCQITQEAGSAAHAKVLFGRKFKGCKIKSMEDITPVQE